VLLDVATLEQQLLGLVWRGGRIDHQSGEHDDFANACAGVVSMLTAEDDEIRLLFSGGGDEPERDVPVTAAATDAERAEVWPHLERCLRALEDGDQVEADAAADALEEYVAALERADPEAGRRVTAHVEKVARAVEAHLDA
jgi:hypothetical protein